MNNLVFKRGDVFSLTHKDKLFTFIIKGREGDNIWGVIYVDNVGEEPMRLKLSMMILYTFIKIKGKNSL